MPRLGGGWVETSLVGVQTTVLLPRRELLAGGGMPDAGTEEGSSLSCSLLGILVTERVWSSAAASNALLGP